MRTLFLSFLLLTGIAISSSQTASAAPMSGNAIGGAAEQSDLLLVRDGCGAGRHFSRWRGFCVWNSAPRYRYYGYRYRPYYGYGYGYRPYGYGYGYPYGSYYYGAPVYGPPYGYYYRRWYW